MVKLNILNCVKYFIILLACDVMTALAFLDCNFDDGYCAWQQDGSDKFDWRRISGRTRTSYTGPDSDHTTGDGHYIYIEASDEEVGDEAKLFSPLQEPGQYCLTFWYTMYGKDTGALNVYCRSEDGDETVIFSKDTDTGSRIWRNAAVSVNVPYNFKIVIEGIRGNGVIGDIAVDDVLMKTGQCSADCNFDNGLCNWTQDENDNFDWILWKGSSPTLGTGPRADHTSGNGRYIYTDSSICDRAGGTARILSPQIDPGKYCFSFWYYMYGNGDHVDSLLVEQWFKNGATKEVFKRQGNFGPSWISENISLHSTTDFKVIFEGSVKNATLLQRHKGDIAVDDVTMISCADCTNPISEHAIANSTNFEYGSVIQISCNSGYDINGESILVCQAGGSWSSSQPTCRSLENNFLITAYVLVPVITVVILAIILAVIIWRKRPMKCMKTSHVGKESDKNSTNYIENQNQNIELDTNVVQQSDYEYTDATSNRGTIEDPVETPYYCTIEAELAEETDCQQRYENADNSTESYESLQAERQTNDQSYDSLNIQE